MKAKKVAGDKIRQFMADIGREMRDKHPLSVKAGPKMMLQSLHPVLKKFAGRKLDKVTKEEISADVEKAVIGLEQYAREEGLDGN